jgi:micrococcal nuclease
MARSTKSIIIYIVVVLLIVTAITLLTDDSDVQTVQLIRVVDGDTIIVDYYGVEERVRLIGVDTPESVGRYENNPEDYGVEASQFTKKLLEDQQTLYMTSDVENRDKYDRLLRYVWLAEPDDQMMEETMVNAILLKEGYANILTIPPNVAYEDQFLRLQRQAREQKKGLWSQ